MKKTVITLVALTTPFLGATVQQKPHEQWWEKNLDHKMQDFAGWLGDDNALSRQVARNYILSKNYQSILDVPCGLCTDYIGYQKSNSTIYYLGLDITKKLVDRAVSLGINAQQGSIEAIPLSDRSIDVCYARHILEHLDYYEKALNELIRVAKKEVLVVFFIKPTATEDRLDLATVDGQLLYHNRYNRAKMEDYIRKNDKVSSFNWEEVDRNEEILHIMIKQN